MNIICSPTGMLNPSCPNSSVMDLKNAGFENILLDLAMCCSPYELEHYGEPKQEEEERDRTPITEDLSGIALFFEKMYKACSTYHLSLPIAHAPFLMRDTKRTDLTELLYEIHTECIRFCGKLGCHKLIIPPLFSGLSYGEEWEANRNYYLRLAKTAQKENVMILLENQCRSVSGHLMRGVCSDPVAAAEWVDVLNQETKAPLFGFCMDVGVCNLCGQDMHEFAAVLGSRIKAVILRDCDGHKESALLPFTCVHGGKPQTDWLGLFRGLREAGFDGDLILSMEDTAIGFSPLLRPQLLALAKAVVEYFKWQIEIENLLKKYQSIVLFGAGNMCRNYMKCYGEQYPPLFTCDNNPKAWGTTFYGLEVKPPESLKQLPKDCGIFICNIYYREIEKQLLEMGIAREQIAYFNDEYMPSFYFDRLKEV